MDNNIQSVLKQLRKTSGYSVNEVVDQLKKYNIDISTKTLYGYESGISMPNADVFVSLCNIYNCDNPMIFFGGDNNYSFEEIDYLKKYRILDDHGKDMVDTVLAKEYDRVEAEKKIIHIQQPEKDYLEPVAARERTDIEVTDEMRRHDDDIMDDPDF